MGGKPANFLDLQGSAYHEKIMTALVTLEEDPFVDSIYVNMFCGNLKADKFAICVKNAFERKMCTKPLVIRLKGLNADEALNILKTVDSQIIHVIDDFDFATQKVIELA
jgi:succinyl-CoA synthetase beta subunit